MRASGRPSGLRRQTQALLPRSRPGSRNSARKGPEAGACLAVSRTPEGQVWMGRTVRGDWKGVDSDLKWVQITLGDAGHGWTSALSLGEAGNTAGF